MTQSEVGVAEVPISLDIMKRLPDQTLLLQEALIRDQQVQVTLVFDHGTEVVVSEEHGDLSLFGRRVEFTQAVIRQLGRRRLQELLRHQTWREQREADSLPVWENAVN